MNKLKKNIKICKKSVEFEIISLRSLYLFCTKSEKRLALVTPWDVKCSDLINSLIFAKLYNLNKISLI